METNVSVERRSFLYLGTLLDYFFLSCTMQRIVFQIACFLIEFSMKPEGEKEHYRITQEPFVCYVSNGTGWVGSEENDNFC